MRRRVLVTGMSGTGKSSAVAALAARGFATVDTDDPGWCVRDATGERVWDEPRIAALLAPAEGPTLYVSGCVANQGAFYDRLEAVVLLSAPAEVLLERVATRGAGGYGSTAEDRATIVDDQGWVEPLLRARATHELDARRPLDAVVADLVAIGGGSPGGGSSPAVGLPTEQR